MRLFSINKSYSPVGVLLLAGLNRHGSRHNSVNTSWKTARGKCACSLRWTGWKTACTFLLIRARYQHQLQRKSPPVHRTCSADCGSTVTTSTTNQKGRISWSGQRSWASQDSACPGSLALCVWKVLSLPARSSGPGTLGVAIFSSWCHTRSL